MLLVSSFYNPGMRLFSTGPSKVAGIENVVTARYVKELVEEQGKTQKK